MTVRIGIFGGTFNPPHFGHLRSALEAREILGLTRVLFLPAGRHPFKREEVLAATHHRLAMTRLAIAHEPGFDLCRLEADQEQTAYTSETLAAIGCRYPDAELVFLFGADLLAEMHLWKDWQRLIALAHLVVLVRPGFQGAWATTDAGRHFASRRVERPEELQRQTDGHGFLVQPVTMLDISATDLRARALAGRSLRYLTPEAVVAYIDAHQLYRP
ncbi:MAG: nicotinate (nicotinamide) nucleotide adenylyltransferase [Magnetococcales bacterium]|nr:nicotinate (nicotinamide) nucleotide adenylyltransferase [Magnetococcales bacterium]